MIDRKRITITFVGVAITALGFVTGLDAAPSSHRVRALVDSLEEADARQRLSAVIDSLLPQVRAGGDSAFLAHLLVLHGGNWARSGNAAVAEPILKEALTLASAVGDTSYLCAALRWLAVAEGALGRWDEVRTGCDQLLEIATLRRDPSYQGWAHFGLGWRAVALGLAEEGVRHYRTAARIFRDLGESDSEIWALNGLGTALHLSGEFDDVIDCYEQVVARARELGSPIPEASALNNLGAMEFSLGDPGRALERFQRAHLLLTEAGHVSAALLAEVNAALCEARLGRLTAAAERLEVLLEECEERGLTIRRAQAAGKLGEIYLDMGRSEDAARTYRKAVSPGNVIHAEADVDCWVGLARAVAARDSLSRAISILEETARMYTGRLPPEHETYLLSHLALLLSAAGRANEALDHALAAEEIACRLGMSQNRIDALVAAARAAARLSQTDTTLAFLERAARTWEEAREVPLDPEWREERGRRGSRIYAWLADLMLQRDGDRPQAAFDRLQTFKVRTLLERMRGPRGEAAPRDVITLAELQCRVLRDGEILLDFYAGDDRSLLFAITTDHCQVVRLPASAVLARKTDAYHDLVADPPPGIESPAAAALRRAARRQVFEFLLGEVAALPGEHRTVYVSPDGSLNRLPFGEIGMAAFGEQPVSPCWVIIPCATVLAELRDRPAREVSADTPRVLALASRGGADLEGAVREARHLHQRYRRVDARILDRTTGFRPDRDLVTADILHVASHAEPNDQAPWQSEIRFLAPGDSANLRAGDIAAMTLPNRLVVLSSCASASGRVVAGEGVLGLTGAFLSAGVPAVLATLWPVDDLATVDLMDRFYRGLARDLTVAEALAESQASMRSRPETSHPYYWAGFVLVGDGGQTFDLAPRGPLHPSLIGLAVVVLLAGLVLIPWLRAAGRRPTSASNAPPP